MAIVIADAQEAIGVVTLEDIIVRRPFRRIPARRTLSSCFGLQEELIGEEIEDEMDLYRRDKYIERVRSSFDTRGRKSPGPGNGLEIPVVHLKRAGGKKKHHHHHHHHHHNSGSTSSHQRRRKSMGSPPTLRSSASASSLPVIDQDLGLEVLDDGAQSDGGRRASLDVPSASPKRRSTDRPADSPTQLVPLKFDDEDVL